MESRRPALIPALQHDSLRREKSMPSKKYQLTDLATGRTSELAAHAGTVGPDVLDISTLQKGELPSAPELARFTDSITRHTMLNEWLLRLYRSFHHNAHPMAMVATIV